MKILVVNTGYLAVPPLTAGPLVGGSIELHTYQLVNELARLGNEVHYVTSINACASFAMGVELQKLRSLPFEYKGGYLQTSFGFLIGGFRAFEGALKAIGNHRYDIVHTHGSISSALLLSAMNRTKFVFTVHNRTPWMFKSSASYKQALRKIAFRMTDQKVIARADCVIAPSTDIRQEIIDHCKAEASKIKTIPNGIDMQLFRPHAVDKAYVRTRYGLDFEYVLFVGRLVEEKAVQTIVKAVAGTQLNAVIVGDGPMLGSLRELASRLGVSRQVHFLGSIARSELPGIYSQAAIFALPSLAEGMPLAGLEAMASGLPIVASSTSGMSGALRDGYNGYFVDPGRHDSLRRRLVQLNEDVSLRKVMGRNSRRIIESEYSWEKTARRTLDVYRTLIA